MNKLNNVAPGICKNCNQALTGNYCSNCGQSAETHKIDLHFLWHDIQHGLFHFDNGIFFSVKELYVRPGHSIREFIEGKRVKHFKPIPFVIILATVYGLLYHSFEINLFFTEDEDIPKLNLDINNWMANHYSWLTLATIPFYTLGTYIAFKNQGYGYIEYFILNAFKASQRLILHIATFPILYYYKDTPTLKTFIYVLYTIDIILIYWTNFQFFNRLGKIKVFIRTIVSHLIFLVCIFLVLIFIVLLFYKPT